MKVRESLESDKESISSLYKSAFDPSEAEAVSELAIDLLEDKTALPILSLVVEKDGEIVGHIIFSAVSIAGADGVSAYILSPLAVAEVAQKSGLGTRLINKGLETLKERGGEIVLVYGDPEYYRRTGFVAGHKLKPPHQLSYPEESWMAKELVENTLATVQGLVQCAASLNSPEHW